MGRISKKVVEEVVDETVATEALNEVKEVVETPKGISYSLTASFKTRNREGDRINHKYKGVGKTLLEALDVVGSDEDLVDEYNKPFPKGVNSNILVVLRTSEGYEFERNIPPYVSRDILENKNVELAAKLLGVKL